MQPTTPDPLRNQQQPATPYLPQAQPTQQPQQGITPDEQQQINAIQQQYVQTATPQGISPQEEQQLRQIEQTLTEIAQNQDLTQLLNQAMSPVTPQLQPETPPMDNSALSQFGVPMSAPPSQPQQQEPIPQEILQTPTNQLADQEPDIAETLRGTKGLTADAIMNTYPNIQLQKDVPITDVYGNKTQIEAGEALTPYELKGNKILLQDGNTYLVSKNQFQNIKGQSLSAEATPFAPELGQLEETMRGGSVLEAQIDALLEDEMGQGMSREEARDFILQDAKEPVATKYETYTLPGGENYREVLIQAPISEDTQNKLFNEFKDKIKEKYNLTNPYDARDKNLLDNNELQQLEELTTTPSTRPKTFRGGHWDEPNVLAHLRLKDRDYNGQKVTFMEELQSDWAREARKNTETPQNPNLKKWQELSVKRALKEAVDNDSEYFAWINGDQTSERYSLATHLNEINWGRQGNNYSVATLEPKNNEAINIHFDDKGVILDDSTIESGRSNDWKGKRIDEVLGKGLADKIMEKESGKLSGEGLKFGGKWAANLYDKQVPNIVKDLTGAIPETIDLGLPLKEDKQRTEHRLAEVDGYGSDLTPDKLKKGLRLIDKDMNRYIVTNVTKSGKYTAKKVDQSELDNDYGIYQLGQQKRMINDDGEIDLSRAFRDKEIMDRFVKEYGQYAEEYDLTPPPTEKQMAVKLTPEIKAKIRGEAPEIKTSGEKFEKKPKK